MPKFVPGPLRMFTLEAPKIVPVSMLLLVLTSSPLKLNEIPDRFLVESANNNNQFLVARKPINLSIARSGLASSLKPIRLPHRHIR